MNIKSIGEKKLSQAIFGLLIVGVFAIVFGPNIYAQFARQTGDAGWGYGYGYGYGFDGGTIAGYRTGGSADPAVYEYDYGYGNIASGVTYNATSGQYELDATNMGDLITGGVAVPNGANPASTTNLTFNDDVHVGIGTSGITIDIPDGTIMTASSAGNFTQLAGANLSNPTDLPAGYTNIGGTALQFGLPTLGLTLSPAITIKIPVDGAYNGRTISILHKAPGSSTWTELTTCVVTSGLCTFTTTSLSSFTTASTSSGGGSGSGSNSTNYCSSVTYSDWQTTCIGNLQYRGIATKTPSGCTLTNAQNNDAKRSCAVVTTPTGEQIVTGVNSQDFSAFVASEKSLVKKINKILAARLSGRILLQVEEKGEAWYVNPVNTLKYFLGRPADAFTIMRKLGLGITEKDYKVLAKAAAPARLYGRILLRVQAHGEAYYVSPVDHKLHYMGRPADAFALMRNLGLGISNVNLRQIGVGELK